MTTSFTPKVELFGGAITVDIPNGFADVSNIRQVPDHQEVYIDVNGYTSIIFEITEHVEKDQASTDEEAIKYHLDDIAEEPGDRLEIWSLDSVRFEKIAPSYSSYTILATHKPQQQPQRPPNPQHTTILLTLLRLPEKKTDILITINIPYIPSEAAREQIDFEAGNFGSHVEAMKEVRERVLKSFEIRDWGLFDA
ncbi:MAG: hypothetical protein M1819_006923 [Sarea resinae]|nr:MAG: hypothetical protein M1819_006923 [Sarea resinae]